MFDPAFTFGRYQDAIAGFPDLTRNGAEPTVVVCNVSGAGVTIPVGALAIDTGSNLYAATVAVTIPAGGGTLSQTFAAVVPGPTVCPAGTLNQIYQAIPGWDTVVNPADGVVGSNTETRAQLEARRQATLQANARSVLAAVRGAILEVAGRPGRLHVAEQYGRPYVDCDGATMPAHSFYAAAVGGLALDVATAIFDKLPPGPTMVGNTVVSVQDTSPPYVSPVPDLLHHVRDTDRAPGRVRGPAGQRRRRPGRRHDAGAERHHQRLRWRRRRPARRDRQHHLRQPVRRPGGRARDMGAHRLARHRVSERAGRGVHRDDR